MPCKCYEKKKVQTISLNVYLWVVFFGGGWEVGIFGGEGYMLLQNTEKEYLCGWKKVESQ